MTTELVLDFEKVRDSDEPLPEIGVADFVPFKGDGRADLKPVKGIVLELRNRQALEQGIEVPGGRGMLYVRLPTGEALAEHVDVVPTQGLTTGTLKLKIAGFTGRFERTAEIAPSFTPVPMREVSDAFRELSDSVEDSDQFEHASGIIHFFPLARMRETSDVFREPSDSIGHADRSRWSTVHYDQQPPMQNLSALLEPFAKAVVDARQGNRGIAKLESSVRTVKLNKDLWHQTGFDGAFVGEVKAAKPAKLYRSGDELYASWKKVSARPLRLSEKRYFALSFEAEEEPAPLQVACIPARWSTLSHEPARISVKYTSHPSPSDPRGSRMVVGVDDPKFSALLQFMQTGDLASSVSLLRLAESALYGKFMNPYAAAAGGYVLTHAGYPLWNQDWGRWLHNLATNFPDIPDGHILLASLILQGPDACKKRIPGYELSNAWQIALESVLESVRRGPPLYRFGLRMLSGSIAILNHLVHAGHESREQLNAAADYVRNLSVRVDRNQPFCVFNVGRNAP